MNENFPDKNQCKIEIAHQNFVIHRMTTRRSRPSKKNLRQHGEAKLGMAPVKDSSQRFEVQVT